MRPRRLLWQLYPTYLLLSLTALLAVAWYASGMLRRFHVERTAEDLLARVRLLEESVRGPLASGEVGRIDALCEELGAKASARVTVILPSGVVAGDSAEDPARMDNHAGRPEVVDALSLGEGVSTRFSRTLGEPMVYAAVPVREGGRTLAVLRGALSLAAVDDAVRALQRQMAIGVLAVAAATAVVSFLVARRITRPLEELRRGAERFAMGELGHRLRVSGAEEISALADSLNRMAAQLDERIRTFVEQRNERDAILSSMVEGVLAVDAGERVIILNEAGARLFGTEPEAAVGRDIREVVRNTRLQEFVARTLSSASPVEAQVSLHVGEEERTLQAHGTILSDGEGGRLGAVVVFNDVTRLRRLEAVRRDFVANVSHELRSPVTAIKASAETLLAGAMEGSGDTRRFLEIIARQSDRLAAIVEDLLTLSRIEEEAEQRHIELEPGPVREVLLAAVEACEPKAAERDLKIHVVCDGDLAARINPALLERAIVNLLDNAIKYSEPGGRVDVTAVRTPAEVVISVRDEGCGIAEEHLPRLFERFYRVDKARSRASGGTGLGLAIVKHVAQAHGGRVSVESAPGEGSLFSIHLPPL